MIRRPLTILILLTGLNLLNYLDRLVVSAVLPKIQLELDVSNFFGGLLATVFLFGYFLTSPAFGALGDRLPRKGLIAFGVIVWSLATMASGLAVGKWSLLLARAFVGVGEASYATLAPTIIDDVTPPEKKGRALAIFYVATPIGAALGYLVGGFVEKNWGWRSAFFVAGGPGILLALVCLLIVEPPRNLAKQKPDVLRDLGKLIKTPLYRKGILGYSAYTAAVGAFSYWAPKFLFQRYGLDLDKANFRFGIVTVIAGAIGTFIGGSMADRGQRKLKAPTAKAEDASQYRDEPPEAAAARLEAHEKSAIEVLLRTCAIGSAIGAPLALACFLSPTSSIFFGFVFFTILAIFFCTSPINAVILRAVPNELRASAMALSIFSIHVFGDLWSPPLVGFFADVLHSAGGQTEGGAIQIAMLALPIAIGASAWLWWPRRAKTA